MSVKILLTTVKDASRGPGLGWRWVLAVAMADVAFVLLTLAVFGVLALVVKGVEKL